MSAALDTLDTAPRVAVPPTLQERIAALIPSLAVRIDRDGYYPTAELQALGQAGLFDAHLSAGTSGTPSVGDAVLRMAELGRYCMASAFCTWCQDAAGYYLEHTANTALRDSLQPDIAAGRILGGTGLSNPMKALSGIEPFRLRGVRAEGGWIVSGTLPWVSNLGDGHWFGSVFEDEAKPGHRIMAMIRIGQDGVTIKQGVRFMALEGTGTYPVTLRKAFIADSQILADPAEALVRRIKPGFILLQTGMALGVVRGSIAQMHAANQTLGHTNRFLPCQATDLEADAQTLEARILTLAATPLDQSPDYLRAVLQVRLDGAEMALAASQAAMLHQGSRAYIEVSPANRLLREAYFVAIVTPSIRHLRQELSALSVH